MTPLKNVWSQIGTVPAMSFTAHGGKNHGSVAWTVPPTGADPLKLRIIVTANNARLPDNETTGHTAAPVVLIDELSLSGFKFTAINIDTVDGEAGFDFFAVLEDTSRTRARTAAPDVRFGISQPKVLSPLGQFADWGAWACRYSQALTGGRADTIVRLLTAHNMGETGLQTVVTNQQKVEQDARGGYTVGRQSFLIPAAGITCKEFSDPHVGMAFMGRSLDSVAGKTGFGWTAMSSGPNSPSMTPELQIDSGFQADPGMHFQGYPSPDDWAYREVQFSRPFSNTPLVLATACAVATTPPSRSPVCAPTVYNPTRFGFTLGGRNVERADGFTGFFWVAIGCDVGCG